MPFTTYTHRQSKITIHIVIPTQTQYAHDKKNIVY